ncbi:MAG: PKD domain-containing protein [Opitutales bacterium]|nr:PKD domain-containing protein [Opitutales bacterium]
MINPFTALFRFLLAAGAVFLFTAESAIFAQTNTTGAALWAEYLLGPEDHAHIPNASFAGYMRGEASIPDVPVVVDIRSFGGAGDGVTPNDMAIREAIEAAWRQGGGAVYFPPGEFLIERMVVLHRDGVVLRGAGPGETIFRFARPLVTGLGSTGQGTQEWNWTGGLLWIGPRDYLRLNAFNSDFLRWNRVPGSAVEFDEDPEVNWGGAWENWSTLGEAGVLASVTSTHERGDWTVTVDDASALRAGDFVMMSWVNPRETHALWREMVQHAAFDGTTLFDQWLSTGVPYWPWPVEIASVVGNEVTLAQPIRVSIRPEYDVNFKRIGLHSRTNATYGDRWQANSPYVEKAGVEDLTLLMNNTRATYSYNNGDGWNGIFFNRAYNSWARNVEILHAETPINVSSAKNISIIDVEIFSPHQSKYISTNRVHSHDILYDGVRVTNTGLLSNGINTEWISTGNVWTRHDMEKGTFDSHRMMSFDYLRTDIVLDNPAESRPGGAGQAGPFTGRRAVHWNITVRDSDRPAAERGLWVYDPEQYTYGAQIGIQGAAPVFRSDASTPNIWAMPTGNKNMLIGDEGIPPAPANLYDAQLAHRLGSTPLIVLDTPGQNFYSTTRPVVLRATGHPGGGVSIEKIRYYRGGQLLAEVGAAPFAFTWENPIPGRHVLTVEMIDNLGNATWSRPYDVVVGRREFLEHNDERIHYSGNWSVRTLAPTAAGDAFFSANQARWTNTDGAYAEVTFRGTRFRWVTGHDSQGAQVFLNGEPMANIGFQRVGNRAYHATVWDSGELPDGIHTVRIARTSGTLHVDHLVIDYTDGDLSIPIPYAFFAVEPASGLPPLTVAVDASLSSGNGLPIESFDWDFGDGTVVSGSEAIRSHTYTEEGEYEIILTVVSSGGTTATHRVTIFVGNRRPVARLLHNPVSGPPPLAVQFDASASTDEDGTLVRYDWDFGDGALLPDGGPIVTHTYADYGDFTATVTVHDDFGDTDTAAVVVAVTDFVLIPPEITAWPIASPLTGGQSLAASNLSGGAASVPGTFAFTDPTIVPPVGSGPQSVTFTPEDTATYQTVIGSVSVTVLPEETGAPFPVFMFNFGAMAYAGNNSPAHAAGAVPADYLDWRTVNDNDVTQTIQIGSWAYPVTAHFRRANGTGANAGVTLNQTSSTANRSTASGSGVFNTALTQSWRAYQRSGGFAGRSVGAYFTGLEPGEYDVYAVVHNPVLIAAGRTTNVGIGVGSATSGDLAWNHPSLTGTSFIATPRTDTWEANINYARVRVTVTPANPIVYVIQGGPAAANDEFDYHTLTAVQIVAVIDPYAAWVDANAIAGGPADLTNGVPNLLRYALGGDAFTPMGELQPQLRSKTTPEGRTLTLRFHRINDPQVRYAVWFSEDLSDWGEAPVWEAFGAPSGVPGPFEVTQPSTGDRGFLRLEVER